MPAPWLEDGPLHRPGRARCRVSRPQSPPILHRGSRKVGALCHSQATEKCPEPAPTDPGRPTPAETERGDASMAVSKRTRYEVLTRDNHTCRYCGGVAPDVVLTVDHVVPTALGGSDKPDNLVAACKDCNAGKASTSPSASTV